MPLFLKKVASLEHGFFIVFYIYIMSGNLSGTLVICIILGLVSWYYFNKFQESEKEYSYLHRRFESVYIENQKMKTRLDDLQNYKNDVSKTFKILDKELEMINDHLQKETPININAQRSASLLPRTTNVSLLTPDILTTLISSTTRNLFAPRQLHQVQQTPQQVRPQTPQLRPQTPQELPQTQQELPQVRPQTPQELPQRQLLSQRQLQPQRLPQVRPPTPQVRQQTPQMYVQLSQPTELERMELASNYSGVEDNYHEHENNYHASEDHASEDHASEDHDPEDLDYKLYLSGNRNYDKYLM